MYRTDWDDDDEKMGFEVELAMLDSAESEMQCQVDSQDIIGQ